MESGSGSEVYRDFFRQGLSSMVMGGRFESGIQKSSRKILLKQS